MTLFCNIFHHFFTPFNSPATQQTACVPTGQLMNLLFYSSEYQDVLMSSLLRINTSRKWRYTVLNYNTQTSTSNTRVILNTKVPGFIFIHTLNVSSPKKSDLHLLILFISPKQVTFLFSITLKIDFFAKNVVLSDS